MINDRKQNVLIQTRTSPSGLMSVKGSGILDFPADDIFNFIANPASRKEYDSNYDSGFYLMKVGAQTLVIYQKTKKISIVSPREFILCLCYNKVILSQVTNL